MSKPKDLDKQMLTPLPNNEALYEAGFRCLTYREGKDEVLAWKCRPGLKDLLTCTTYVHESTCTTRTTRVFQVAHNKNSQVRTQIPPHTPKPQHAATDPELYTKGWRYKTFPDHNSMKLWTKRPVYNPEHYKFMPTPSMVIWMLIEKPNSHYDTDRYQIAQLGLTEKTHQVTLPESIIRHYQANPRPRPRTP